eukprot:TRINITY_DN10247_c0_g1_i5.p1 TRINITY_DN10247_c0_g1~~TRINITY_DN10247_c0_g1_i5.p1  ORF type:complete len:430 (+),score=60.50 TRINITY_DN10247_c0_g1_i5:107-1291(+)
MSGICFSLGGEGSRKVASKPSSAESSKKRDRSIPLFGIDSDSEEDSNNTDSVKNENIEYPQKRQRLADLEKEVDPQTQNVSIKLAEFVARNGRKFEDITRERNQGQQSLFKFLFDKKSIEYKFYEAKLEDYLQKSKGVQNKQADTQEPGNRADIDTSVQPPQSVVEKVQMIVNKLENGRAFPRHTERPHRPPSQELVLESTKPEKQDQSNQVELRSQNQDSVAAMEAAYAQMVAKKSSGNDKDSKKQDVELNETSFDRRRVYAVFKNDGTRGHHMQDFIPPEELAKFLAQCKDSHSKSVAARLEEQQKITSDNVGHKLLSKMGWREGEGLGASKNGKSAPVQAGSTKQNNLGLGAKGDFEVHEDDDIYDQYRKRMMLGYRHRPNPLGNPRKKYY